VNGRAFTGVASFGLISAMRPACCADMNDVWLHFSFFGAPVTITWWKLIGYVGATMFAGRWFVQWWAARSAGRVVVPRLFWYMSVVGSIMTLCYFVWGKNDSVGILQNLFPSFVAVYNLWLDVRHRGWNREKVQPA
jgi:lipid-A-disaccharide synthase-like uncharacterized protein